MNSNMKRLLKECFEAPEPKKKREFIASLPSPDVSIMDFLLSQAAYIPKWIWSLSALIFVVALVGAGYLKKDMLWCVSACMPLLALAPVTESGRSQRWNMAELEMSSRFSLKSVLLARLGILGLADLLLFFLLLPLDLDERRQFHSGNRGIYALPLYAHRTSGAVGKPHCSRAGMRLPLRCHRPGRSFGKCFAVSDDSGVLCPA